MEESPSQKAIVPLLVKIFPAFYGTRRFIMDLTRARNWSLSWARRLQSTPSRRLHL